MRCVLFQGFVENYFSCIRSLGGSGEHPDRLQAFQRARIKLLTLEIDHIVPIEKPSVCAEMSTSSCEPGDRWENPDLFLMGSSVSSEEDISLPA